MLPRNVPEGGLGHDHPFSLRSGSPNWPRSQAWCLSKCPGIPLHKDCPRRAPALSNTRPRGGAPRRRTIDSPPCVSSQASAVKLPTPPAPASRRSRSAARSQPAGRSASPRGRRARPHTCGPAPVRDVLATFVLAVASQAVIHDAGLHRVPRTRRPSCNARAGDRRRTAPHRWLRPGCPRDSSGFPSRRTACSLRVPACRDLDHCRAYSSMIEIIPLVQVSCHSFDPYANTPPTPAAPEGRRLEMSSRFLEPEIEQPRGQRSRRCRKPASSSSFRTRGRSRPSTGTCGAGPASILLEIKTLDDFRTQDSHVRQERYPGLPGQHRRPVRGAAVHAARGTTSCTATSGTTSDPAHCGVMGRRAAPADGHGP